MSSRNAPPRGGALRDDTKTAVRETSGLMEGLDVGLHLDWYKSVLQIRTLDQAPELSDITLQTSILELIK